MMREEFIDLPFFRENGWLKKTCPLCGRLFWTLDPDRKVCGDQPCEEYGFIGGSVGIKPGTVSEVRSRFVNFFASKNHAHVRRYPVVARWREDVFLVGASIYNFQPWVTEGLVPPPANPLVISQPSIRLTDLDNVGRTGRHLTGFEMMAHHAFNIGDQHVYWADETVAYAFEFFTKVLGVKPEEVIFIFDVWSGGGNAGEDYEVIIRGLEVATLVFMHYKTLNDREFIPMPNRIVDTGYGLERIFWLLTGNYNVYEAVFPGIIEKLRETAGVAKPPEDLLHALATKSGRLDYKKPLEARKTLGQVASEIGMPVEDLLRTLQPHEAIYALADHTRTLTWMIGDGVVPSNSGAGYLARLLIRRCLRLLKALQVELPLSEIISWQIKYWRDDFPEYEEVEDEIRDIIDYEEERFTETLRRGEKVVSDILEALKQQGSKVVPAEEALELYESHGIPPELLKERAEAEGLEVDITGFYSKLAELKSKIVAEEKRAVQLPIDPSLASKLTPTRMLYYEDEKLAAFEAKVLDIISGKYLVLDQTAFYPEGGGQLPDTGTIYHTKGECRVKGAYKVGNVILHECEGPLPEIGERVRGTIDLEHRMSLMRHHTATHIILGSLRHVLGKHVWQAGAQKTPEYARFDFTHHKPITPEEARRIELLANQVVMEDRPVKKYLMNRTQAEQRFGFTLYQGGAVPQTTLRIVEIPGWDAEACGGTHCDRTGEVGLIKILGFEKIQDGVVRVIFKAGKPAIQHVQEAAEKLREVQETLQARYEEVGAKAKQLVKRVEELERELKRLREELLKGKPQLTPIATVSGINIYTFHSDDYNPREAATTLAKNQAKSIVLAYNSRGNFALKVTNDLLDRLDARKIGQILSQTLRGKGGGVNDLYQGHIQDTRSINNALIEAVKRSLQPSASND
ncbi:MAG: alanine--tRNA ligase [Thermofilum sp.]|nr:alanine--tRNA ligase [Thermofilum sp.]